MTTKEFEDLLTQTKVQFIDTFNGAENFKDLDIYVKTLLDYQEIIAKTLFSELSNIKNDLSIIKGDILKDNRLRFEKIMEKLSKNDD